MAIVTVKMNGDLRKYGTGFVMHADTANDVIKSLCCQIDGLKNRLKEGFYNLKINGVDVSEEQYKDIASLNSDKCVISITPAIKGAGKWGQIIAGAVLVVVGIIGNVMGGWGTPFIQAGIGLMIGGAAALLTKAPKFNQNNQGVEDTKSSGFSNLNGMIGQGKQVMRVYGEIVTSGLTISQGITSHRSDSGSNINSIETAEYERKSIELIPATDPDGKRYNIDRGADSVKSAATVIVAKWG